MAKRKKPAGATDADPEPVPCPKCNKDITSNQSDPSGRGIQCETCDKWYHTDCLGWSADQYSFVANNNCLHFSETLVGTVTGMVLKSLPILPIMKVEVKVDKLAKVLDQSLGLSDTDGSTQPPSNTSSHITSRPTYAAALAQGNTFQAKIVRHIKSISDEERMKRCLVFSGMPENGTDLQDVSALCQKLDPSSTVYETFRMGTIDRSADNTGPRILKVVFPSASVAKSILFEARSLSRDKDLARDYGSVFIRKPMTYEKRSKLYSLRKQRDDLNKAEDNKVTRIHYAVVKNEVKRFVNCELEDDKLVNGTLDNDWQAPPPPPPQPRQNRKNGDRGHNAAGVQKK